MGAGVTSLSFLLSERAVCDGLNLKDLGKQALIGAACGFIGGLVSASALGAIIGFDMLAQAGTSIATHAAGGAVAGGMGNLAYSFGDLFFSGLLRTEHWKAILVRLCLTTLLGAGVGAVAGYLVGARVSGTTSQYTDDVLEKMVTTVVSQSGDFTNVSLNQIYRLCMKTLKTVAMMKSTEVVSLVAQGSVKAVKIGVQQGLNVAQKYPVTHTISLPSALSPRQEVEMKAAEEDDGAYLEDRGEELSVSWGTLQEEAVKLAMLEGLIRNLISECPFLAFSASALAACLRTFTTQGIGAITVTDVTDQVRNCRAYFTFVARDSYVIMVVEQPEGNKVQLAHGDICTVGQGTHKVWFQGLSGRITEYDEEHIKKAPTNGVFTFEGPITRRFLVEGSKISSKISQILDDDGNLCFGW